MLILALQVVFVTGLLAFFAGFLCLMFIFRKVVLRNEIPANPPEERYARLHEAVLKTGRLVTSTSLGRAARNLVLWGGLVVVCGVLVQEVFRHMVGI